MPLMGHVLGGHGCNDDGRPGIQCRATGIFSAVMATAARRAPTCSDGMPSIFSPGRTAVTSHAPAYNAGLPGHLLGGRGYRCGACADPQ